MYNCLIIYQMKLKDFVILIKCLWVEWSRKTYFLLFSSKTNYAGTPGMKLIHFQYLLIIFVCFLVKPQLVLGMTAGLIGMCLLLVVLKRRRKGIISWSNHFPFSLSLKSFSANFLNSSETIKTSKIYFQSFLLSKFSSWRCLYGLLLALKKFIQVFFISVDGFWHYWIYFEDGKLF